MKKRRISFRLIYLIFVLLLAALVAAALLYVRSLLKEYEASQPDLLARTAVTQLANHAAAGDFWSKYGLPDVSAGPFEQGRDIKAEYMALFSENGLTVSQTASTEDELYYTAKHAGKPLAEIKLKAAGLAVTKLAVLSLRDWTVESVTPLFSAQDYTLTVPNSFSVQLNGTELTADYGTPSGERQTEYTVTGLYLTPEFLITDADGNAADYALKNGQVAVEYYDYDLTLPGALTVTAVGKPISGQPIGSGLLRYEITRAADPELRISDFYGNTVEYQGGSQLPLTHRVIKADETYTMQVNGLAVPSDAITVLENPEYTSFAQYVPNLPRLVTCHIAILQEDADIAVTDSQGNPITLEDGAAEHDLTRHVRYLDAVPAEVASQVDVLQIAQNWSMFMTADLPFNQIKGSMIAGSYQYNVALKYATGVDIQFTSKHTLADPAFTENNVTNFTWITDNCFSVDISFVKHMRLYYGAMVDDPMNDRFYFVRYDDTDNGVDDPMWKLAGMKEIV